MSDAKYNLKCAVYRLPRGLFTGTGTVLSVVLCADLFREVTREVLSAAKFCGTARARGAATERLAWAS
jgi:hypothetical protein